MIPKIIHYVWLSGEEKPEKIFECIKSWSEILPDFEIREWTMADVQNIDSKFLHDAIAAKKWAFATDFLRFYIIYNYGGVYMDSDIFVYRDITPLMNCNGFTSLEGSSILQTENKKHKKYKLDFGLEAAMFGAIARSPWIKNILDFYNGLKFENNLDFFLSIIAPKVMWERTLPFGLREIMSFQKLKDEILIYPHDILSCISDFSLYQIQPNEYSKIGKINPVKYACHLCTNSWGWKRKETFNEKIKKLIINFIGADLAVNMKAKLKTVIKFHRK